MQGRLLGTAHATPAVQRLPCNSLCRHPARRAAKPAKDEQSPCSSPAASAVQTACWTTVPAERQPPVRNTPCHAAAPDLQQRLPMTTLASGIAGCEGAALDDRWRQPAPVAHDFQPRCTACPSGSSTGRAARTPMQQHLGGCTSCSATLPVVQQCFLCAAPPAQHTCVSPATAGRHCAFCDTVPACSCARCAQGLLYSCSNLHVAAPGAQEPRSSCSGASGAAAPAGQERLLCCTAYSAAAPAVPFCCRAGDPAVLPRLPRSSARCNSTSRTQQPSMAAAPAVLQCRRCGSTAYFSAARTGRPCLPAAVPAAQEPLPRTGMPDARSSAFAAAASVVRYRVATALLLPCGATTCLAAAAPVQQRLQDSSAARAAAFPVRQCPAKQRLLCGELLLAAGPAAQPRLPAAAPAVQEHLARTALPDARSDVCHVRASAVQHRVAALPTKRHRTKTRCPLWATLLGRGHHQGATHTHIALVRTQVCPPRLAQGLQEKHFRECVTSLPKPRKPALNLLRHPPLT